MSNSPFVRFTVEIERRLKLITQANGYNTDLGTGVFLHDIELDPSVAERGVVAVADVSNIVEEGGRLDFMAGSGMRARVERPITYYGIDLPPANRDDWLTAADDLLSDMKRAIFGPVTARENYFSRVAKVRTLAVQGGEVERPRSSDQRIIVALTLTPTYVEDLGNPQS